MQYPTFNHTKGLASLIFFLFVFISSLAEGRSLSDDVVKAMDQANACRTMNILNRYERCFQETNERLESAIKSSSLISMHRFSVSKKRKIMDNIQTRIASNNKKCRGEGKFYGDSHTGQRRLPYCIYENMLEILITVERNISLYSKK